MTQKKEKNEHVYFRKRPSVKDLLDHPWISPKVSPLQPVAVKSESLAQTPKSTPVSQRKSLSCMTETPKSQRKTFCSDPMNGGYTDTAVCTYTVSTNCLCPQCGPTCRRLTHTPVTKTPITVDRGILC